MGEYIPGAPINDEVRKRNQSLPGMGGVFNYVNLHVYHYAGNNPVKLVDPDGKYLINNVARGSWNARVHVRRGFKIPEGTAQFFSPGVPIPLIAVPKQFEGQLVLSDDYIQLDPALTNALDVALGNRDVSTITASAKEIENGNYEINVTVEVKGKTQVTATVAFADKNEVLDDFGEKIDVNKVRAIANETINIDRNTVASTNNIDEVR